MSHITTVHAYLKSKLATALSTHSIMNNPYFPEDEDVLTLTKCYGLSMSDGTLSTVRQYVIDVTQQFTLLIARKTFALKTSKVARETAELALFEDRLTAAKAIYAGTLEGNAPYISDINITNDGGIEFIRGDRPDIILLRSIIDVRFHESTN